MDLKDKIAKKTFAFFSYRFTSISHYDYLSFSITRHGHSTFLYEQQNASCKNDPKLLKENQKRKKRTKFQTIPMSCMVQIKHKPLVIDSLAFGNISFEI